MSKVIKVRPVQVHAAKLLVRHAEMLGEDVSPAIRALAQTVIRTVPPRQAANALAPTVSVEEAAQAYADGLLDAHEAVQTELERSGTSMSAEQTAAVLRKMHQYLRQHQRTVDEVDSEPSEAPSELPR